MKGTASVNYKLLEATNVVHVWDSNGIGNGGKLPHLLKKRENVFHQPSATYVVNFGTISRKSSQVKLGEQQQQQQHHGGLTLQTLDDDRGSKTTSLGTSVVVTRSLTPNPALSREGIFHLGVLTVLCE
jgi:hypothetical protein